MADVNRFQDVNEQDLLNLLENRDSLNTKNVIKGALNIFKTYCLEKHVDFNGGLNSVSELNSVLCKFYAAARTKSGDYYSKKTLLSIRYGLQKHFEKDKGIDIVNSLDFKEANKIFKAMLVNLKQEGKATVKHKVPLSKEDLTRLYRSFDLKTPKGLQDKVFVDFMLFFCNRGRENLREIKKSDFIIDEKQRYIQLKDMATKNHKGDLQDSDSQGGRIYEIGGEMCPYASFTHYIAVLHPDCDYFFQRPKSKWNNTLWFDNVPQGKNMLGDKMRKLSSEAQLSQTYTNHCLRATSITLLDSYEARHVMTVSGHKSESSIRSYARTCDDQKKKMALTIAEAASGKDVTSVLQPRQVLVNAGQNGEIDTNVCESDLDILELTSSQQNALLCDISDVINNDNIFEDILPFDNNHGKENVCTLPDNHNHTGHIFQNTTISCIPCQLQFRFQCTISLIQMYISIITIEFYKYMDVEY